MWPHSMIRNLGIKPTCLIPSHIRTIIVITLCWRNCYLSLIQNNVNKFFQHSHHYARVMQLHYTYHPILHNQHSITTKFLIRSCYSIAQYNFPRVWFPNGMDSLFTPSFYIPLINHLNDIWNVDLKKNYQYK